MKQQKIFSYIVLLVVGILFAGQVLAETSGGEIPQADEAYIKMIDEMNQAQTDAAKGGVYEFKTVKQEAAGLNPMDISGPSDLFANAINLMMAFIGSVAILLYIYGGFLWMSAAGNADRVGRAKTILIWTTFGAVAMAASYMIVKTVLEKVG